MKKYVPWILLVAVLVSGAYIYAKWRGDLKVAEEKIRAGKELAAIQQKQIDEQAALTARIEAQLAKDQAASAERERWYQANIVTHVAQATPQQLVDEGARLLGAADISTDGTHVTLGLESWRRAVLIMLNEEEYRKEREPSWLRDKASYEAIIASQKVEIAKHIEREAGLEGTIDSLSKALAIRKTLSLIEKVSYTGLGFAGAKGLDALTALLKGK